MTDFRYWPNKCIWRTLVTIIYNHQTGSISDLYILGDYLLASCLKNLGGLYNNEVTELISTGLRDLVEGEFLGDHDDDNNPLPSRPTGKKGFT